MMIAVAVMAVLIFTAIGPFRRLLAQSAAPLKPPSLGLIGTAACVWATLWYALVLLAFGIAPEFPPAIAVAGGVFLSAAILLLLPRWTVHPDWGDMHQFVTICGAMLGSMLVSFVGFIGSLPLDLYFKIGVDVIALLLLIALGAHLRRQVTERPCDICEASAGVVYDRGENVLARNEMKRRPD